MTPQGAVFFNEDDPNDKIGTSTERNDEQSRVNKEIKEYFNDNFEVNTNAAYSGGFGANNYGWYNGMWNIQIETNKRLNYLQHSVDELRGTINVVGKKLGANNTKLH
jgi:N-formylglutamate amidohydrolase